jgi:Na+-translocating ferredoxin:NAD+ oxidoreductase subunit G
MIIKSIFSNSIALALFALATALVLSSVDNLTRDKIDYAERMAAQRALLEIVPPERHNNNLLLDTQPVPEASGTG